MTLAREANILALRACCVYRAENQEVPNATEKGEKAEVVCFYLIPLPLIPNINFIPTSLLVKVERKQAASRPKEHSCRIKQKRGGSSPNKIPLLY